MNERPNDPTTQLPLEGRTILLGVSGSIAAYKAADLASKLAHAGAEVHVILTQHAAEFVGAATFRALTLNPVLSGVFDEPHARMIAHVDLAQRADLIVVAPASANIIAKMALGIADDLLSTSLLAATAPIIVAPAMNSAMLAHAATQANLATLRDRGVTIVEPAYGVLACRTEGEGKLADVETILMAIHKAFGDQAVRHSGMQDQAQQPNDPTTQRPNDLSGVGVLVTAGATREPLDPVRFISNRSSGRMGYAIADAARERGATVTVVSGVASVPAPHGVELIHVETTDEMLAACEAHFSECDVFIAAAAPADYTPEQVSPEKRRKAGDSWVISLKETPDILAKLGERKVHQVMVGFAAETGDLVNQATEKLRRKNLDLIVANDVTADGAGFDVETNIVALILPDGHHEQLPLLTKHEVADRILDTVKPLIDSLR